MERTKIGDSYFRSGANRTHRRKANIYLIDGFAYARDKSTAETDFNPLVGELAGFVRVNGHKNIADNSVFFSQISGHSDHNKHLPFN